MTGEWTERVDFDASVGIGCATCGHECDVILYQDRTSDRPSRFDTAEGYDPSFDRSGTELPRELARFRVEAIDVAIVSSE